MNNQSEKPGYGYQLAHGATSLTEEWDTRRISSQNHFMLGQINEWFYHDLAGIAPDASAPGFKHIVIRPQPVGDITLARATHESPRGKIAVAWKREADRFELACEIPPNTTATVFVPCTDPSVVTEGGARAELRPGVRLMRAESGAAVFEVKSGKFGFSAPLK